MGNQNKPNSSSSGDQPKILLKLRTRDIILHYAFKMTLVISDIAIFPHELQGLKLWDIDIILSRYIILESQKFRSKDVLVFKAGVGIAAITMRKWTDAKAVTMCDFREEVIKNELSNCSKNNVKGISSFKINYDEMLKSAIKYDTILFPDLLSQGFPPLLIIDIIRKLLNVRGEVIMIIQENKESAKVFISAVDRGEFKIANYILTAGQYETSPLLNKLQGQKEFPSVSGSSFYAISLIKIDQDKGKGENSAQNVQKQSDKLQKIQKKQQKIEIKSHNEVLAHKNLQINNQLQRQIKEPYIKLIKKDDVKQQDLQNQIIVPVSLDSNTQRNEQDSPHKELDLKQQEKEQKVPKNIVIKQVQKEQIEQAIVERDQNAIMQQIQELQPQQNEDPLKQQIKNEENIQEKEEKSDYNIQQQKQLDQQFQLKETSNEIIEVQTITIDPKIQIQASQQVNSPQKKDNPVQSLPQAEAENQQTQTANILQSKIEPLETNLEQAEKVEAVNIQKQE